jgi:hypothetical protein
LQSLAHSLEQEKAREVNVKIRIQSLPTFTVGGANNKSKR